MWGSDSERHQPDGWFLTIVVILATLLLAALCGIKVPTGQPPAPSGTTERR